MKKNPVQLLYFTNQILCSPLDCMFTILVFIISKQTYAIPLQIGILTALKPVGSLVAFYLNSFINEKPRRIRIYLIVLNFFGCLPCIFFPLIENIWFYILSFALFIITRRASFPAWAEVLKSNIGVSQMSSTVSKGASIQFIMISFLPLVFSFWMDQNPEIWKVLFSVLGILQLLNIFFLSFLKINSVEKPNTKSFHVFAFLKDAWGELRGSIPFSNYLMMYFLGGTGIVMMHSILPIYFKNDLDLSYTQLTLAFSFCKGFSFLLTSSLWARFVNQVSLYRINCFVNLLICLFVIFIFLAKLHPGCLFLGYLIYGAMQSGNELSWNMSGPVFSKEKESTVFSSLNLLLVGLRGCIFPFLGQMMFFYSGTTGVFGAAFVLSLISILYAYLLDIIFKSSENRVVI